MILSLFEVKYETVAKSKVVLAPFFIIQVVENSANMTLVQAYLLKKPMQFLARKGILFLESITLFMCTWKLLVGSVSLN